MITKSVFRHKNLFMNFVFIHRVNKGDYTRTGERNLAGLVKDGMNSANRYVHLN